MLNDKYLNKLGTWRDKPAVLVQEDNSYYVLQNYSDGTPCSTINRRNHPEFKYSYVFRFDSRETDVLDKIGFKLNSTPIKSSSSNLVFKYPKKLSI